MESGSQLKNFSITGASDGRAFGTIRRNQRLFVFELQNTDVAQVAVTLGVVKPIADNEFVWNCKSDIIGMDGLDASRGLIEERSNAQRLRA